MKMFQEIMQKVYAGNTIKEYALALFTFLTSLIMIRLFRYVLLRRLKEWAKKTATTLDDFLIDVIEKTVVPFLYCGVFYLSLNTLILSSILQEIINVSFLAVATIFSVRLMSAFISYGFKVYLDKRSGNFTLERSLGGILRVIKIIIWGLAIVFFLENRGIKITAVAAGLGIGGVAVALAAQAVLKDLFSYFAIIFDRPFEEGDFIIIGEYLGTVEDIGIKTTRIRSLGGEQLIFSNTDLTDSRVRNYKRMERRRVLFRFGVIYQTTSVQLKEIPKIVKTIIEGVGDTAFDRAHFASYGDSSLTFEVVYYILSSDYNKYMDVQQKINLGLKEEFEKKDIEFAYPTQTLYINKESS